MDSGNAFFGWRKKELTKSMLVGSTWYKSKEQYGR